jgi:rRNA biogenesis protein RRP5
MAGKTRTTSAHGPTSAKKPFKQDKSKQPPSFNSTSAPSSSARTFKPRPDDGKTPAERYEERKRKAEEEPEKAQVKSSLLNAPEEIDFPRGGGSGLTQVEVREAQLEGEKEARDEDDAVRFFSRLFLLPRRKRSLFPL